MMKVICEKRRRNGAAYRLILFITIMVTFLSLSGGDAYAGQATLTWTAPATSSDGSRLTDLAGYKVYYGTASRSYSRNVDVGNVRSYTVANLNEGATYYFAVSAYDTSKNESRLSNEMSKRITALSSDIIVDNKSAATSRTGTWYASGASGSYGTDSVWSRNGTTFSWIFTPSQTGSREVSMWWTQWESRSSSIPVDIQHAGGTKRVFINQQQNGGKWNILGTYSFTAGQTYRVTITSQPSPSSTCADAVKFGPALSAPSQYTLTVSKSGTGTGTVTSSPAGISCDTDCSQTYNAGTSVTLTATPGAASNFAGWSGACAGNATCAVAMDAAKTVTANFGMKTYTITASAGQGGSISPSGSVSVNYGSGKSFAITPASDNKITDVLVDNKSVGAVSSYTFSNITASHTIRAVFSSASAETIIDNRDPETAKTGTWDVSGSTGFYGQDSVWSRNGSTFSWFFTPVESGDYDLAMWWTQWESRSSSIPVDIEYSGGKSKTTINQKLNGGKWNPLGTYSFNAGATYRITVTSQPSPASTCADAVKLTPTADTIIDNMDAETYRTGSWASSVGEGFYGRDSVWGRNGSTFTWRFTPLTTGNYEVGMWWTQWSSRSNNIPVDIKHANGTKRLYVNQQQNGNKWNNFGTYLFNAGATYTVTITSQAYPTSTCADAVKFRKQ